MKTIFEASTGLEAYMILNLLEQAGIEGRVEGEYLQGGMGELQAMNLVRVRVDDRDYALARSVLAEWEARQPAPEPERVRSTGSSRAGLGFLLGLVAGAAGVYGFYHSPVEQHGIDYDRDGVLDEQRLYVDGRIAQTHIDRNGDGQPDLIHFFDRRGLLERSDADDDFDGHYESRQKYVHGQPALRETDVDRDGEIDLRARYTDGVLSATEILDTDTGLLRKTQRYQLGKRTASGYDADADGTLDVFREYDFYEEMRRSSGTAFDAGASAAPPLRGPVGHEERL
jgi:hypothetical protein